MTDRKLTVISGEGAAPLVVHQRIRVANDASVPYRRFDVVTLGPPYHLRLTVFEGGPPAVPGAHLADPPPAAEAKAPSPGTRRGARTFKVGKRDLRILKIRGRKRRLYRVAEEDLTRAGCWLTAAGWYVDTLSPPATWLSNDPFGPYKTAGAAEADADLAYRDEEA